MTEDLKYRVYNVMAVEDGGHISMICYDDVLHDSDCLPANCYV